MSSTPHERTKKGSKDAAAERLSTPDQLDQIIRVATFPTWIALWALLAILITGVWAAFVVEIPVTVRGQGILINPGGILAVVSETEGRLAKLTIELDQEIGYDDVVAEIAQPEIQQQIRSNDGALEQARGRLDKITDFQRLSRTAQDRGIEQQRETLRERSDAVQQRLENLQDLYRKQLENRDLFSQVQLRETEDRVNRTRDELNTIGDEIANFKEVVAERELDDQREILQLELEISDLQRRGRRLRAELEQKSRVHSPYAGRVVEIKVNEGDVIARHDALFSLLPADAPSSANGPPAGDSKTSPCRAQHDDLDGALIGVFYVPSADGKKIERGDEAQLELAPFKREKFGFLRGCVEEIAEVPSTRKGMMRVLQNSQLVEQLSGAVAPFEVRVLLRRDPETQTGYRWTLGKGPPEQIYVGTLGESFIVTEKLHPVEILLPEITRAIGDG